MRFLKYLFLLSCIFFGVSYLSSFVLDRGLRQTEEDVFGKIKYYLQEDSTNYDILFIGSSRTLAHVNPAIVDSITGYNTYNGGINGITIGEIELLIKKYLENHIAPKYIVINIDHFTLDTNVEISEVQKYYPYTSDEEIVTTISRHDNKLELLRKYPFLKIFYYTDVICYISLKELFGFNYQTSNSLEKGYRDNYSKWNVGDDNLIENKESIETPYTTEGKIILEEILKLCKTNRVTPILVFAPTYKSYFDKFENIDGVFSEIGAIISKDEIPFLRYDKLYPIIEEKKYFYDPTHLNYYGATAFSIKLANDLKKMKLD